MNNLLTETQEVKLILDFFWLFTSFHSSVSLIQRIKMWLEMQYIAGCNIIEFCSLIFHFSENKQTPYSAHTF
jgi:hypothetical protein